jgi:RNA exonuclease 1
MSKSTTESLNLAFIPQFNGNNNSSSIKKSSYSLVNQKNPLNTSSTNIKLSISDENLNKICKRCNKTFHISAKSMLYSNENSQCIYHWGKLRNVRFNKLTEQKYSCCSGEVNSSGCQVGRHVYDGEYDGYGTGKNLVGYVETQEAITPESILNSKTANNIYALDCEMCYTTRGLELARVTIVDINMKEVYESLVKPEAEIIDYNTRWSGLTASSLKSCTKRLKQVQEDLLKLFNKDSILIGHSLDSDFKALKFIHQNVIDTSVVFPHKSGLPYKRALRNLMSEYLQKIIQEDGSFIIMIFFLLIKRNSFDFEIFEDEGHDSKEDATSCIQLMLWKINEDLKLKKFSNLNNSTIKMTESSSLITNNQSDKSENTKRMLKDSFKKEINNFKMVLTNSQKISTNQSLKQLHLTHK